MKIIRIQMEVTFDDDVTHEEVDEAMENLADKGSYCHAKAQDAEIVSWRCDEKLPREK